MIDFVKVGKKIQQLRIEKQYSQDVLAEKLYVTRQALSRWENGLSFPSIDTLLELCKVLNTSFEELLCLDQPLEIDPNNIFNGYDRQIIINKIINKEIDISLSDVFYQFSPTERLQVLKAIKEGKIICNMDDLLVKLTLSEQKFLGGDYYAIKKTHNRW